MESVLIRNQIKNEGNIRQELPDSKLNQQETGNMNVR
jgi:hypothetical protein